MLEARARARRVDVLGEPDLPLERAVLDLHLLVDAARDLRALAARRVIRSTRSPATTLTLCGSTPGSSTTTVSCVRVVGVEAVDVRPEAVPDAREARHLPEVGEELLDLLLQLVDVAPRHGP